MEIWWIDNFTKISNKSTSAENSFIRRQPESDAAKAQRMQQIIRTKHKKRNKKNVERKKGLKIKSKWMQYLNVKCIRYPWNAIILNSFNSCRRAVLNATEKIIWK